MEHDRRIDVTLAIHLEGTDTQTETDVVVERLRAHLADTVILGPGRGFERGYVKVMSTDDPIHVHNVQQGRRV